MMSRIVVAAMGLALAVVPMGLPANQALAPDPGSVDMAPAAWDRQDPADSIYRAARTAMNRGEHEAAAELFRRIWQRHGGSTYAPDAPYWEAFNRYRTGETRQLERALASLETQQQRYPRASTRENGDAASLRSRIRGQLASRGDEDAAREMVAVAMAAAGEVAGPAMMAAQQALEALDIQGITMEAMAAAEAGMQAASAALGGGMGSIPEGCREEVEIHSAALNALMNMSAERALPVLAQIMERRDECAAPLRRRAVFLIADKESPRSVELLLAAAREDPDLEVRRQAVFWLSEVDDRRAVDALAEFVTQAGDEQLRERAVFALAQHNDPRARTYLRRVAGDGAAPAAVRRRAIFWLGEEGTAEDARFLQGLFGRTGDADLDERILLSVGQAGGPESGRWLLGIAANADVPLELRKRAVFWAGEAGAPAGELGALYTRFEDVEMKERILFALSESEQSAAVEHLIRIARTEPDAGLRKKAIFWLGNSRDPRAAEALMELLTRPPR